MSFILDALKKAEKERNRGTVPDLLAIHEPIIHKSKKRSILFYLLIGVLLINAVVLVLLLNTQHINKTSSVFHSSDETGVKSKQTASSLGNNATIDKQDIQIFSEQSTSVSTKSSDIEEEIPDDINITERLQHAGEILGIRVIDHIIIGDKGYYSFSQHNLL